VYNGTTSGKPIKVVFFIQLVCSFINIACSSHYLAVNTSGNRVPTLPKAAAARIGQLQFKSYWRPTNDIIDKPINE
jgi:hypothetical protein